MFSQGWRFTLELSLTTFKFKEQNFDVEEFGEEVKEFRLHSFLKDILNYLSPQIF